MRKRTGNSAQKPTKSRAAILDRIKPVSQLPLVVTAMIYGRSGTGKTTLAASFPGPRLVLDIRERGTDSISDVPDTDCLPILEWSDMEDIYWELQAGRAEYRTVILDAVHPLQSLAIQWAKGDRLGREAGPMDQTTKHDFMRASGMLQTWMQNFVDLQDQGINVVFLCHDKHRDGEGDGDSEMITPEVGPNLMPSVASMITGAVKIVGHTFIREEITKSKRVGVKPTRKMEYCLRIGPHGFYHTKVRSNKELFVPEYLTDPTYEDIVEVMKGQMAAPAAKVSQKPRRVLGRS